MSEDEFFEDIPDHGSRRRDRMKKVIADAYSSDSSDDEEQVIDGKNAPVEDSKEDDDDSDMFASDDDDNQPKADEGIDAVRSDASAKRQDKKTKKMDMDQFERDLELEEDQIMQESHDEDDVEIEAFNLRQEEEEGYFDDDGNFIRHQTSDHELEDDWVNVDKYEIHKAKIAQQAQQVKPARIKESTEELLGVLINHLEPDESPLELLARLAPAKRKKSGKRKSKAPETEKEKSSKQLVMQLTDVCDKLMIHKGLPDLYDMVREELMRLYRRETGTDFKVSRGVKRSIEEVEEVQTEPLEDYGEKVWEYRWDDSDEVYGPHSEYEMDYWKQNYFDHKVYVRQVGQSQFVHIDEVTFQP